MAVIFRKLSQKRHWDNAPWLEQEDTQADATKCLATNENRLSVFVLDEPDEQAGRVVAALAATRDHLAHIDMAVVPENIIEQCSIQWVGTTGQTLDSEVNGWHRDLIELTIAKITRLASAIKREGQIERYNLKRVGRAIKQSVDADCFGPEHMAGELVQSLSRRGFI